MRKQRKKTRKEWQDIEERVEEKKGTQEEKLEERFALRV